MREEAMRPNRKIERTAQSPTSEVCVHAPRPDSAVDARAALSALVAALRAIEAGDDQPNIQALVACMKAHRRFLHFAVNESGDTIGHLIVREADSILLEAVLREFPSNEHDLIFDSAYHIGEPAQPSSNEHAGDVDGEEDKEGDETELIATDSANSKVSEDLTRPLQNNWFSYANDQGQSPIHELLALRTTTDVQRNRLVQCFAIAYQHAQCAFADALSFEYISRIRANHRVTLLNSVNSSEALAFVHMLYTNAEWVRACADRAVIEKLAELVTDPTATGHLYHWMSVLMRVPRLAPSLASQVYQKTSQQKWDALLGMHVASTVYRGRWSKTPERPHRKAFHSMMAALTPRAALRLAYFAERKGFLPIRHYYKFTRLSNHRGTILRDVDSRRRLSPLAPSLRFMTNFEYGLFHKTEEQYIFSNESGFEERQAKMQRLLAGETQSVLNAIADPDALKNNIFVSAFHYAMDYIRDHCRNADTLWAHLQKPYETQMQDRLANVLFLFHVFDLFEDADSANDAMMMLMNSERFTRTVRHEDSSLQTNVFSHLFRYSAQRKVAGLKAPHTPATLQAQYRTFMLTLMLAPHKLDPEQQFFTEHTKRGPEVWTLQSLLWDPRVGFEVYRRLMSSAVQHQLRHALQQAPQSKTELDFNEVVGTLHALEQQVFIVGSGYSPLASLRSKYRYYNKAAEAKDLVVFVRHEQEDHQTHCDDPRRTYDSLIDVAQMLRSELGIAGEINADVQLVLNENINFFQAIMDGKLNTAKSQTRQQRFIEILQHIEATPNVELTDNRISQIMKAIQQKANWPDAKAYMLRRYKAALFRLDVAYVQSHTVSKAVDGFVGLPAMDRRSVDTYLTKIYSSLDYNQISAKQLKTTLISSYKTLPYLHHELMDRLLDVAEERQGLDRFIFHYILRRGTVEQIRRAAMSIPLDDKHLGQQGMRALIFSHKRLNIVSGDPLSLVVKHAYSDGDFAMHGTRQKVKVPHRLEDEFKRDAAKHQALAFLTAFTDVHIMLAHKQAQQAEGRGGDYDLKIKCWVAVIELIDKTLYAKGDIGATLDSEFRKLQGMRGITRGSRFMKALARLIHVAKESSDRFAALFIDYQKMYSLHQLSEPQRPQGLEVSKPMQVIAQALYARVKLRHANVQAVKAVAAARKRSALSLFASTPQNPNPFMAAFDRLQHMRALKQLFANHFKEDIFQWFGNIVRVKAIGLMDNVEVGALREESTLCEAVRNAEVGALPKALRSAMGKVSLYSKALDALYSEMKENPQLALQHYRGARAALGAIAADEGAGSRSSLAAFILEPKATSQRPSLLSVDGDDEDGADDSCAL